MIIPDLDAIEARLRNGPGNDSWEWPPDDVDDSMICSSGGGAVASVHYHGNLRAIQATGEKFSHADARFIAGAPDDIRSLLAYARACRSMLAKHQHCEIDFPSSGCPECEWGHGLHAPDCELARLVGPAK